MKPSLTECRAYPAIAVATVIEFEDVRDDATHASILVSDKQSCAMVKVGTAGKTQYGEQFWQCIDLSQGMEVSGISCVRRVKTQIPILKRSG